MRKKVAGMAAGGLFCIILFSACSGKSLNNVFEGFRMTSTAEADDITEQSAGLKEGVTTSDAGLMEERTEKIQFMKSSGNAVYDYGQPLWVSDCSEFISLRSDDDTSADVLDKIPLNARVTYLGRADNGFLHVNYDGITGYALKKYLSANEPKSGINLYMTVVDCDESISLRKKPSKSADEICQIPLDSVVYVIKSVSDEFYMVKFRGEVGYALARYLKPDAATPDAGSVSSGYYYGQPMWVVQCNEFISLRYEASTSADVILHIPLYSQVTYLGGASNGFAYVVYNGVKGYALKKYLDEFEPQIAIGMYMTVSNCKQSITLRTKPSTNADEICQVPLGAIVYAIKDAGNGFYMVDYDGRSGYVLSEYLKYWRGI